MGQVGGKEPALLPQTQIARGSGGSLAACLASPAGGVTHTTGGLAHTTGGLAHTTGAGFFDQHLTHAVCRWGLFV